MARIALVLILIAIGIGIGITLSFPELLPPHPYHPISIYYRFRGIEVHPFVPVDPQEAYRFELSGTDWPVHGLQGLSYRDFLQGIVEGFKETHPNVSVKLHLPPLEGREDKDGSLPDIYLGTLEGLPAPLDARVPVTPFVSKEDFPHYDPVAIQAVTWEGMLLAWPHSIGIWGWAGNSDLMRRVGAEPGIIIQSGWTWEEFTLIATKMVGTSLPREDLKVFGLGLDNSNTVYFEHLLLNSGLTSLVDSQGKPTWDASQVLDTLRFLDSLRSQGLLPDHGADMPWEFLSLFWKGRTGFIAPVGPPFLRYLWDRKTLLIPEEPSSDVNPVLLPVPSKTRGMRRSPVEMIAAQVFWDRRDPARARLAVELAQKLSRGRGSWLASKLRTVPAYLPDREWQRNVFQFWELGPEFVREGLRHAKTSFPGGPQAISARERLLSEVIGPALRDFWEDRSTAEEAAHRILSPRPPPEAQGRSSR